MPGLAAGVRRSRISARRLINDLKLLWRRHDEWLCVSFGLYSFELGRSDFIIRDAKNKAVIQQTIHPDRLSRISVSKPQCHEIDTTAAYLPGDVRWPQSTLLVVLGVRLGRLGGLTPLSGLLLLCPGLMEGSVLMTSKAVNVT